MCNDDEIDRGGKDWKNFYVYCSRYVLSVFCFLVFHFSLVNDETLLPQRDRIYYTYTQDCVSSFPEMFFRFLVSTFVVSCVLVEEFWIFIYEHENVLLQYWSWKRLGLNHQSTHTYTHIVHCDPETNNDVPYLHT